MATDTTVRSFAATNLDVAFDESFNLWLVTLPDGTNLTFPGDARLSELAAQLGLVAFDYHQAPGPTVMV